jgi:glycosyltransferase involved in cell wall biosynthesis
MSTTPNPPHHALTVVDAIGAGGGERVAAALATLLDPARFRRTLCVTRQPDNASTEGFIAELRRLEAAGVRVIFLGRSGRLDVRSLWRLARVLRTSGAHIVHAHKFGSNVWAAVLGRLVGVPVVIAHEHTWSFERQLARRLIDRFVVAGLSDAVIAVSEADRRRMISVVRMPRERVTVIPNGIPEPHPRHAALVRSNLGIADEAPLLVQTAVLRPQKAIGTMLEAMAILREREPAARLVILGPGDPRALQSRAAELGVLDVVSFIGQRDDVADILAAADTGVLSSDFEGMPLAILEYMAAGLPVVSTDVGGVPEVVREGETGLLVPRGDSRALAERIGRLITDPELARRMGENGRRLQQERFSAAAMVRETAALYDRLLADARISSV